MNFHLSGFRADLRQAARWAPVELTGIKQPLRNKRERFVAALSCRVSKRNFFVHFTKGPCKALCQSISLSMMPISRCSTLVNRVGSKRGANNDLKLALIFARTETGLFAHGFAGSKCDVNSYVSAYFMMFSSVGCTNKISVY